MIHTNALIVWLLMGFIGATYYLLPEETETRALQPVAGEAAVLAVLRRGRHRGRRLSVPLSTKGASSSSSRSAIKIGIVVVCLIFLFNVTMTALKGRKTTVTNILLFGLWGVAIFFLFAFYNPANLAVDKMYWWYVVHLWVEGVWELIMASVLAFLMIKLTGIDREVVEKWLYVIIGLALFSGILGTGHHYLLDRRARLLAVDRLAVLHPRGRALLHHGDLHLQMTWKAGRKHPNRAALLWSLGCSVMAFFGAGVWGFLHTCPR